MLKPADILGARILIVDDQAANVQLLTRLLTEAGYRDVSGCMQPDEVARLHLENAFDLILLDIQMPTKDGFAVMEELKAIQPDDYLPVIVLTSQPAHKQRALEAGAKDFISKPFDLLEVRTRIHNMLEVRLLYRELARYNEVLEQTVSERTAELRSSEQRFRDFTRLASDWYWEQDETGRLLTESGPAMQILGMAQTQTSSNPMADPLREDPQRETLRNIIAARQPFLDFLFTSHGEDGSQRKFRVSGEPVFSDRGRFTGYRGIGIEYGQNDHQTA